MASWSMVPVFLTTKGTSPAGAVAGDTVRVMGAPKSLLSPNVTFTVVTGADDGILTPSSNEFTPVAELGFFAHPASAPTSPMQAMTVAIRRPRCTNAPPNTRPTPGCACAPDDTELPRHRRGPYDPQFGAGAESRA